MANIFLKLNNACLHRRNVKTIPPTAKECFIAGDTLAVQINEKRVDIYEYDRVEDVYKRIQEPLKDDFLVSISFDQEYLVYSRAPILESCNPNYDCFEQESIFIYQRQDGNQYEFQQRINHTDNSGYMSDADIRNRMLPHEFLSFSGYEASISHDRGMIVVRGVNQTQFFVQDISGYWEEVSLTFDQSYKGYQLFGRDLLAILHNETTNKDEVYYFGIEDCERSPTQMPSSSLAPSISKHPTPEPSIIVTGFGTGGGWGSPPPAYRTLSPMSSSPTSNPTSSMAPTKTPLPSASPTLSHSPTETCWWADITIVFDSYPRETSWVMQRINADDTNMILKTFNINGTESDNGEVQKESVCLQEGEYQFTVYDSGSDGICCNFGEGKYNIMVYEEVIVEGGEFGLGETTKFGIPFNNQVIAITTSPTANPTTPFPTGSEIPPGQTYQPTTTQWPTPVTWPPNFTPFPTEASPGPTPTSTTACYQIEITISFDAYPKETSWQLLMNTSNDEMLIIENSTAYNSTLANGYSQRLFCLQEGSYMFIIHDQDGLCCLYGSGSYNLTSDGDIVGEGGAFQFNETTLFSVPFSP